MVALDESNIEIQWECPPCNKKKNPNPVPDFEELEPPQQTVAKLPRPRLTPSVPVPAPAPAPAMTLPRPILPQPPSRPVVGVARTVTNGVTKTPVPAPAPTNGAANDRLSFPDVRIRDLPFYPVKATLLRPCTLVSKNNSTVGRMLFPYF